MRYGSLAMICALVVTAALAQEPATASQPTPAEKPGVVKPAMVVDEKPSPRFPTVQVST